MNRIYMSIFLTLVFFNQITLANKLSCDYIFNTTDNSAFLIPMQSQYTGEDQGYYFDKTTRRYWNVHYFNETELNRFTLVFKDSFLYDYKNEKYSTEFDNETGNYKEALIVWSADEKLLVLPFESRGLYHHSSLSRGKAVLFAGTITIANGQILEVSDFSGHYKPNSDSLRRFISFIASQHINLKKLVVSGVNVYEKTKQHSLTYSEYLKSLSAE